MSTQLNELPYTTDDAGEGGAPPGTRHSRRRPWVIAAAVAVIAAAVGVGIGMVVDDDEDTTTTAPTTASTQPSTESTSPTSSPTTPTTAVVDTSTAVFPTDGSGFDDPVEAARAFAIDIGFGDPVVGEFQQGDSRSGEVSVRPLADGPITTVFVRQLGSDDRWFVLGSATASIQLTSPSALEVVTSPLRLVGTSTAFEATVGTELRQDVVPEVLATGFVMGGSMGEIGPFAGALEFPVPASDYGTLILSTESMRDGSTWEAAVLRVRFDASATPATTTLLVYFTPTGDPDAEPVAYERVVPATTGVLRAALEQLLAGPTESERAAGASSWFSAETADLLLGVRIDDGVAIVDFGDLRAVIPNASSSAGSHMLLSELDATVFQFDTVDAVVYQLEGDPVAFNEWLQMGGSEPRPRP
jgi:hypothetical protein